MLIYEKNEKNSNDNKGLLLTLLSDQTLGVFFLQAMLRRIVQKTIIQLLISPILISELVDLAVVLI